MEQELDISAVLKQRFALLPKAVQHAILSSNIERHLQELSKEHKLHLDQWVNLENEVMMVLLGLRPLDELSGRIRAETGVSAEDAAHIAQKVSESIFEPIRRELERELSNPNAKPEEVSPEEARRQEMLAEAHAEEARDQAPDAAAAPAAPAPKLQGDPYREPIA
jgi:hypothetical protein